MKTQIVLLLVAIIGLLASCKKDIPRHCENVLVYHITKPFTGPEIVDSVQTINTYCDDQLNAILAQDQTFVSIPGAVVYTVVTIMKNGNN